MLACFRDLADEAILYEDDDVIVLNKPAGVTCQAASPEESDDLPARLRRYLAARRGVAEEDVYIGTHQRLDQGTSGTILYTLRKEANATMAEQFEGRVVEKVYVAGVTGAALPRVEQALVHSLAMGKDGRMQVVRADDPTGKPARTKVRVLQQIEGRALLQADISTGRTHQIRVQFAHSGWPIAGDALYGNTPALRMMLHASALAFHRPSDGRRIRIEAPTPLELQDWLANGESPAYSDPVLLTRALQLAIERRFALAQRHARGDTTVFRLIHDDGDGFPGLTVDVYGQHLVVRTVGDVAEADLEQVLDALHALGFAGIYLKRHPKQASDLVDPRDERVAPALPVRGTPVPDVIEVVEQGMPFEVRLHDGLRTGLFLDQRDNRQRVRGVSSGKSVLNLFAYTGSFSVAALSGGALSVTSVDLSQTALQWAERNAARIGATERHRVIADDAFDVLGRMHARGERFDLVIVDPPSYSTSKRGRFQVTKDYAELCRAALLVLTDGGTLLGCLNHHGISQSMLRRFVQDAAGLAGVFIEQLRDAGPQRDFPCRVGDEPSMKSVWCRVRHRADSQAPASGHRPGASTRPVRRRSR